MKGIKFNNYGDKCPRSGINDFKDQGESSLNSKIWELIIDIVIVIDP